MPTNQDVQSGERDERGADDQRGPLPGIDAILVPDHTRAISSTVLSLSVGSLQDPEGKEGLAYLTGQMMTRGAGSWSHAALMDEVDFLGSSLSVGVGRERTSVSGDALSRNLDTFESLVGAVLTAPRFEEAELDKLRRQTIAELAQVQDSDSALGQRFFVRALFDGHPYGRPLKGTTASLTSVGIADVKAFYEAHMVQRGIVAGAAGDMTTERFMGFVSRTAGGLPARPPTDTPPPRMETAAGYRATLVDKPDRSQTQVFLGHVTVDGNHDDFMPLLVAQTIFGGTFTARLSRELREKRGWTYGAYSYLSTDQHLGTFTMRFYPSVADTLPALKLTDEMYRALVSEGVTADEVDFAKSYLQNGHAFSIDTAERRLSELLSARIHGRPDDFVDTFVERVGRVTPDAVNAAIRAHLFPERMICTIVATASDLAPALEGWERVSDLNVVDYRTPI